MPKYSFSGNEILANFLSFSLISNSVCMCRLIAFSQRKNKKYYCLASVVSVKNLVPHRFQMESPQGLTMALPLTSFVTLNKLLTLSEPQCLICKV